MPSKDRPADTGVLFEVAVFKEIIKEKQPGSIEWSTNIETKEDKLERQEITQYLKE